MAISRNVSNDCSGPHIDVVDGYQIEADRDNLDEHQSHYAHKVLVLERGLNDVPRETDRCEEQQEISRVFLQCGVPGLRCGFEFLSRGIE